ncbi:MAG: gliding motility protein GldL [Bacteroidales bacterium]|nr:gliding motility protein GldL [Bacteroidales bacterium]
MGTNKGKKQGWFGRMVRSHGFRQFMSKTYGIGAAIVLLGAMFKINHFPGANIMLIAGLGVEAFIFFMSAFEPLHEEVDWSLVYPELGGGEGAAAAGAARVAAPRSFSGVEQPLLTEKLDQMLHSANIDANLLSSLKDGLTKLNTTAQNLNASADIVGVNANYAGELDKLTESLGRLNSIYTQQIEASSRQMEVTMKAQQDMSRIAEALAGTLESSAKSVAEMNSLSEKVNSLNKVYGGMLSAFKSIGKDS